MATTTIQVREETIHLLKRYKEQTKAQTYDEAILNVFRLGNIAKSFRGVLGKKDLHWVKKNLRDKKDRF